MININALNIQHSAKTRFGGADRHYRQTATKGYIQHSAKTRFGGADRHYRQTATKGSQEGAVPAKTRQVREMGQRNREVFKDWPTSSGCETWISLPHDWKTKQTPKWKSLPLAHPVQLATVHSIPGYAIKALASKTISLPTPSSWASLPRCSLV